MDRSTELRLPAIIFALAFVEGAMVMIVELCGAKLLAPYFGTSIDVWASTLAITLGGLTTGYFLGASLTSGEAKRNISRLRTALLIGSILIISLPFYGPYVLDWSLNFPLTIGASVALLLFLFPILVCLGCSSPLLIQILSDGKDAGKIAGKIYGISTIGGIISTYLVGLFLLSTVGIKATLIASGIILMITTLLTFGFKWSRFFIFYFVLFSCILVFSSFKFRNYSEQFDIIYESDGLLGNIKVIDHSSEAFTKYPKEGRGLVVNNTLQTYMDLNGPGISIWDWAHFIPTIAGTKGMNQDALLIGLGGGTVYKQLQLLESNVDVVEIDKRVKDVAIQYFEVPAEANIQICDGRYFLKKSQKKYDVIIYDAFLSESPPEHLLTYEGLSEAKSKLNQGGIIIINFFGFLSGKKGYSSRSLAKTILETDLKLDIVATPGEEEYRNLLFVAYNGSRPDYKMSQYAEPGRQKIGAWEKRVISSNKLNLFDAEVLTDQIPKLSKLYLEPAKSWRKGYNEIYTKKLYR